MIRFCRRCFKPGIVPLLHAAVSARYRPVQRRLSQAAATSQPRLRRALTTAPWSRFSPHPHRGSSGAAEALQRGLCGARETLWRPRGYLTPPRAAAGLVMGTVTGSWRRPWIRFAEGLKSGSKRPSGSASETAPQTGSFRSL